MFQTTTNNNIFIVKTRFKKSLRYLQRCGNSFQWKRMHVTNIKVLPLLRLYIGSWIYLYLSNHCLSSLWIVILSHVHGEYTGLSNSWHLSMEADNVTHNTRYALRPKYFYSLLVNFESLPLIFCNLPRHAPSIRSSPETWPPLSGHLLTSTHPTHTLWSKSKASPFGVLIFLIVFFYAKVGGFLAWYRQVNKKWRG